MPRQDETGKCTKCAHQREIERASTDEERKRLRSICIRCIRGCDKCATQYRLDALKDYMDFLREGKDYADLLLLKKDVESRNCKKCKHSSSLRCQSSCQAADERKRVERIASVFREVDDWNRKYANKHIPKKHMTVIQAEEERELLKRTKCGKCTHCPSTDDEYCHSGRSVMSFDAAEEPDTIQPFFDPLAFQKQERDPRDFDEPVDPREERTKGSVTKMLAPEVEELLRQQIMDFHHHLDFIDRELVFQLMEGKTLVDFAKMGWAEPVIKALSQPMTKQAVWGRYKRIVKRVPILAAVAHGMIGKGKGGAKHKQKNQPFIQQDLFSQ